MRPEMQKIVFATDLSQDATSVFRYAVSLAEKYQGRIYGIHVVEPLNGFAQSLVDSSLGEEKSKQIREQKKKEIFEDIQQRMQNFCHEEVCRLVDPNDTPVAEIAVREGHPTDQILKYCESVEADIIVIGAHRRVGVTHLFGSTARSVVHDSSIPVLVVHPREED
ncbi:MAG: universal stress protein [Desulfohalobiaceae bacterium]|nr:universal stress protein [Desulfohalobiaceae bacterium]MCF8085470.1 universal stress protein [Desulfohalobiaceae bacterium]